MPINDWRCMICGYFKIDVLHVADLGKCPECGSMSWTKVPPKPTFKVRDGTPKYFDKDT